MNSNIGHISSKVNLLWLVVCLLLCQMPVLSQELNCNVKVNADQVPNVNKRIFETLEKAIYEFMNNTKWTDDVFKPEERIECNILITVNSAINNSEFMATIQVQSTRPVYNTAYNSTILNYNDKNFQFKYVEFQPLEFSNTTFLSNLTAVLAFYAYYIIAMDYETFSLKGGTPYFQKAQNIVNLAQNTPEPGWKAFDAPDQNNRYWIVENMLNQYFEPIRFCLYKYHRLGLDIMAQDPEKARKEIFEALKLLEKVFDQRPGNFQLQMFFNAKSQEIINIFSKADPNQKQEVVQLLSKINPQNASKYREILNR